MPMTFSNWRVDAIDGPQEGSFVAASPHGGFALTGLVVRAGAWVDAVGALFSELLDDGRLGAEVVGPRFGGPGGYGESVIRATPGHVFVGIQTRGGAFVDAVRLAEAAWDGRDIGAVRWTTWVGGDGSGGIERRPFLTNAGNRELLVGLGGRARTYVEALSGVAATVHRVAPAPFIQPRPMRGDQIAG